MNTFFAYTVAKEGGTPASDYTTEALSPADLVVCLHIALIELRVNLAAAFDQIKRRDGRVGQALSMTRLAAIYLATSAQLSILTQASMPPMVQAI